MRFARLGPTHCIAVATAAVVAAAAIAAATAAAAAAQVRGDVAQLRVGQFAGVGWGGWFLESADLGGRAGAGGLSRVRVALRPGAGGRARRAGNGARR